MVTKGRTSITGLLLVWLALSANPAVAATYYVAQNGKNSNSCAQARSSSSPKQTINEGLQCLAPGDTLYVRAGTYDEQINKNVPSGTSWSSVVRIAAYPGETVWLRPSGDHSGQQSIITLGSPATSRYIEFDGIGIDGRGFRSGYGVQNVHLECSSAGTGTDHIRFKNLESIGAAGGSEVGGGPVHFGIYGGASYCSGGYEFQNLTIHGGGGPEGGGRCSFGFYIADRNVLIENNDIYDLACWGMQTNQQVYGGGAAGTVIRNNKIHDITRTSVGVVYGYAGIVLSDNGDGAEVYNNVIYNIGRPGADGAGIYAYNAGSNQIYNNTVYGNVGIKGIYIITNNNTVRNNISYYNSGGDYVNAGSGTVSSNNLFGIDPKFVNPTASDFRLQSGSPAIDAGTRTAIVTTDQSGMQRPQGGAYDVGAFEWTATPSAAPPVPSGLHIVQ